MATVHDESNPSCDCLGCRIRRTPKRPSPPQTTNRFDLPQFTPSASASDAELVAIADDPIAFVASQYADGIGVFEIETKLAKAGFNGTEIDQLMQEADEATPQGGGWGAIVGGILLIGSAIGFQVGMYLWLGRFSATPIGTLLVGGAGLVQVVRGVDQLTKLRKR